MIQSLRSPEQLRDLAARGVAATLHPASGPMPTVASAAAALGIPVAAMTKNIVCLAGGAPVLVIAAGLARIDDRALARHLGAVLMLLPLLLLLPGSGGPRAAGSDRPAGRAAPAAGMTFVLYDGARGSTPDAQGMALNPPSLATRQS
ncbi:MAG TPA: YbaK/EbsC family protein, partial [Roseiflexaceae bacterium]